MPHPLLLNCLFCWSTWLLDACGLYKSCMCCTPRFTFTLWTLTRIILAQTFQRCERARRHQTPELPGYRTVMFATFSLLWSFWSSLTTKSNLSIKPTFENVSACLIWSSTLHLKEKEQQRGKYHTGSQLKMTRKQGFSFFFSGSLTSVYIMLRILKLVE